ncbi:ribonuclease R [Luteibaculum oceani]|uniref:Ribonuclease R n=1 Tax=Luteibaculum oceani TaxID=1294296 RepID=A0A5C6VLM1_9FLAO|nr:ribonuclease R [Luteibaculum oceani]TXC85356.1 ribonuclease R [Luteibaculum oceani]
MAKKESLSDQKINEFLEKGIKQLFKYHSHQSFNYKQIASRLEIRDKLTRERVIKILKTLVEKEFLVDNGRGRFKLNPEKSNFVGKIEITKKGSGYFIMEDGKDLFISARNTGTAFDGDIVKVKSASKRGRSEYFVTEIVERNRKIFTGIVHLNDKFAFVEPDDPKINADFFVPEGAMPSKIEDGQKVVLEFLEWKNPDKNPVGKIIQVLGFPGDNEAEIHAVIATYNLPTKFPKKVVEEANQLYKQDHKKEYKNRRDYRDVTTFTIDPHDAKDFDDALSVKYLENGCYEIGVHIADVTHFLQPDTALDKEAIKRATSVYLVDRVIPMLPEVLSNDLCSLRPEEDRFAFSAIFTLNDEAKVLDKWFGKTVIHSNRRFAYEEAQEIIEGKSGDLDKEILLLDGLAKKLREKRLKNGAIEFGGEEVKFVLDKNAKPKEVVVKSSKDANKLIEEFMLLANRKVAEEIGKKEGKAKTFVYRVHDKPDEDKLASLKSFLSYFGLKLQHVKGKAAAFALNRLLKSVEGKSYEGIVKNLAIRSMAKAEYSTENIGHYGLAFEHYTHFTSPIRRYPDVMVHRLLQHYLAGGKSAYEKEFALLCRHCSNQEKNATEAERASIKYMQVLFMVEHVGEEFDGVVTGITPWGFFVELEKTKCEGLVSLDNMDDDHYHFDDRKHKLVGKRYGREIHFGDRVLVKVLNADIIEKKLDFSLVDVYENFD